MTGVGPAYVGMHSFRKCRRIRHHFHVPGADRWPLCDRWTDQIPTTCQKNAKVLATGTDCPKMSSISTLPATLRIRGTGLAHADGAGG
jgi:hypothetical protein